MTRRLVSLFVLLILLVAPALADKMALGPRNFVVGVPTEQFAHFAAPEGAGRQRMQNWCWAACIQMVLNYHGLHVKQEDIVSQVFGTQVDLPAQPEQIMAALRGWVPDTRGRYSEVVADAVNLDQASIIQDLEYRWPLIVGLSGASPGQQGHAYVLTGAYYMLDDYNRPEIYRVVLRDPYPTQLSRLEMTADQFVPRCAFATRVHVRRM